MPVRIGFLSTAHMHAWGYAHGLKSRPEAELVGIWDPVPERAMEFAKHFETRTFSTREALLESCDAAIITCENKLHAEYVEAAAAAGKPVLCEKPLVTTIEEKERIFAALEKYGTKLMTAFPCRYSPAFIRLNERVGSGEIGAIQGICATNRGRCPGGWFIDVSVSGGGAMIDHVVHVTDLLRVMLKQDPVRVHAFKGNNMHGQEWDDTAMLTLEFPSGLFATLDSSWSRSKSYKTWGDVTMNVVGDKGVIEMDMFNQALEVYRDEPSSHYIAGFGSDMDAGLVSAFLNCVIENAPAPIDHVDGWKASQVALAGYESSRTGQPVNLA